MQNTPLLDDDEDELSATLYFDATAPEAGPLPQQSFIFGPGNFYSSSHAESPRALFGETPKNMTTAAYTNWPFVVRHWALSTLFLPLYAVALITYSWKTAPEKMSRLRGSLIIGASILFYTCLWIIFGLQVRYATVRHFFPPQQACFVIFLYVMCCFAESMLKNTQSIRVAAEQHAEQHHVIRTLQETDEPADSFLDHILERANPTAKRIRQVTIVSVLVALLYAGGVAFLHIYTLLGSTTAPLSKEAGAALVVYIVVVTLVQGVLCLVILHPLGQVALRLFVRDRVARLFAAHTTAGKFAFRLDSIGNIDAWQNVRDTLLRRYAFPSLYVDVVITAAFTLWIPLVVVGALDFVFRSTISTLGLNVAALAVLVLAYLLGCVVLAADVQETLSRTEPLRWQEYRFLVSAAKTPHDIQTAGVTRLLKRLAVLIDQGRGDAVVFQVWGFPLNRKMSTFLGGVMLTVASSVMLRMFGSGGVAQ